MPVFEANKTRVNQQSNNQRVSKNTKNTISKARDKHNNKSKAIKKATKIKTTKLKKRKTNTLK